MIRLALFCCLAFVLFFLFRRSILSCLFGFLTNQTQTFVSLSLLGQSHEKKNQGQVLSKTVQKRWSQDDTHPEAVARRCSVEKVFQKFHKIHRKNTCARVSFLIKLQVDVTVQHICYFFTFFMNKLKTPVKQIKILFVSLVYDCK